MFHFGLVDKTYEGEVVTNHSSQFRPRKGLGASSDWKGVGGFCLNLHLWKTQV